MGVVRLFLAWVVAAGHWRIISLPPPIAALMDDNVKMGFNAGYAVMFFYVISGFLITYTLSWNYNPDPAGRREFYRKRFVRIYSLYWPIVLATFLLVPGVWNQFINNTLLNQVTGIFLIGMDWNLAFGTYPLLNWSASIGALSQAWTLGLELVFYLAAPFLIHSWKIGFFVMIASFSVRGAFVIALGPALHDVWTYHFAVTSFGFFLLGQLIFLLGRNIAALNSPLLGILFLSFSFMVMTFGGSYAPFDGGRFWASILLFTFCLPGLFRATKDIRWMNELGNLSYPVYLVHTLTLVLLSEWMASLIPVRTLPEAYLSTATFLVITTAVSLLIHKLIEVPVAKVMNLLWLRFRSNGD